MEILLVNKFFYPRAGAETAFFHTRDLLLERGHDVIDFAMKDDKNVESAFADHFAPARTYDSGLRRLPDAAAAVYSIQAKRALSALLDRARPAVAHLHNVYHQLTLSIVDELDARGIPIVQTLHDYKVACPSYNLYTEGAPCRRCVNGSVLNAVRHKCVMGSRPASALGALELTLARRRGTYGKIDRVIAPSRFVASVANMGGIGDDRISLVPYLLPDSEFAAPVDLDAERPPAFFFGGRLDETKGVRQLLEAFERVPAPATLRIAGWGDLQGAVERAAAANPRITYLGTLSREQVLAELSSSRALLLPSTWEDNCPLIMLEAQARATPVIASDRGGPPEFVRPGVDGLVVDPDDIAALAAQIVRLADDPAGAREMGRSAYDVVRERHAAAAHYERLMEAYGAAAEYRARRRSG
jgi:glycosyltransferase involved in cell wall biosynthesis